MTRDTTALGVGTGVNGALAYAYFALVTRTLGAEAAAPVTVLWSYWAATAAVVTFPLQHWLIRGLAVPGGEPVVRRALPRVGAAVTALSMLAGAGAWAGRVPLFGQAGALLPILVAGVTASACLSGLLRGGLAGRRRFVATAWAIVGEGLVRLAVAVGAAVAGAGAGAFAVALALGPLVWVAWPDALRLRPDERQAPDPQPAGSALAFLGGLAGGSLIGQVVLTGGPVALTLIGGAPAAVTGLFAALALWRAPYIVALGIVTQLTGPFTRLVMVGRRRRLRALRLLTVGGTLAGAAVAAAAGGLLGAPLVRLVFGAGIGVAPSLNALIAAGTVAAMGNLVLALLLVARGRTRPVLGAWVAALAAALGWIAAGVGGAPARVVVGFAGGEVVAFALLLAFEARAVSPAAR